ncbi:papilin [Caerostris darwini]|uniref:Papilin n=1 Tax=Caerostris darwini TaxID=1538125 RepID=A0AAV4NT68_9ARAC|nr:papilin [Caerostris darwini]
MSRLLYLLLLAAVVWQAHGDKEYVDAESTESLPLDSNEDDREFKCGGSNGYYPNFKDCTTYIECKNRVKTIKSCPDGQHWNAQTIRCDDACNAYCNATMACQCRWSTCGRDKICSLMKIVGPCRGRSERYFFNIRSGKCEKFLYSGCMGNENNFETMEECEQRCKKPRPPEPDWKCLIDGYYTNPDNCSTYIACSNRKEYIMSCPKGLHFDHQRQRCEKPCDAYCDKSLSCQCKWATCGTDDVCFLPRIIGPCRAGFSSYYFNKRTGECEHFYYGGCKGNENRFKNKEECENKCKTKKPEEPEFTCYKDGTYPNPKNCTTFIQCSNGQKYIRECPSGLHYSDKTERCEQPCDAYCNVKLSCQCRWPTCGRKEVCFLPAETGPCRASFPNYYFNKRSGKCEKFTYGGCMGNGNNFRTEEACRKTCGRSTLAPPEIPSSDKEQCRLMPEVGPCKTFKPRYYYDAHKKKCDKFIYGGCEGNANNFETEEECNTACGDSGAEEDSGAQEDTCRLPAEVGTCHAHMERYYFDHEQGRCLKFIYGGCGGNANNFETERECENSCLRAAEKPELPLPEFTCYSDGLYANPKNCSTFIHCSNRQKYIQECPSGLHYSDKTERCEQPCNAYCNVKLSCLCRWPTCGRKEVCFLPAETGPCMGRFPNYYFNKRSGKCEKFTYGGCLGNENNFRTEEACRKTCGGSTLAPPEIPSSDKEQCRLMPEVGPCTTFKPRYYYDAHKKKCDKFIYGGCEGNENNFETEEECNTACGESGAEEDSGAQEDTCRLPAEIGTCHAHIERYYFDREQGRCVKFIYGGCGGNANNFETERECENSCLRNADSEEEERDTCRLPVEKGPCHGYMERYYFNHEQGRCLKFIYGGCRGNANNYVSKRECENRCLRSAGPTDVTCRQEPEKGPCRGHFRKFYFDPKERKCKEFVYGGCGGNDNKFETTEECETTCLRNTELSSSKDIKPKGIWCQSNERQPLDDCTKYVQCFGNGTYEFKIESCPENQHFSYPLLRCTKPCEAYCDNKIACECGWGWPACKDDKKGSTCSTDGLYKNPKDCNSYIQCSDGVEYEMPCPRGLHFSEQTSKCEQPSVAQCEKSEESSDDFQCEEDGRYVNLNSCSHFINCTGGVRYDAACPQQLHFNEKTRECDSPCDSRCDPSLALECGWPMGAPKCPKFEHYDYCYAKCQKNCSNWDQDIPCNMMCFPGCVCDEYRVRGPDGKCIRTSECRKHEESEEEFRCYKPDGNTPFPGDSRKYIKCTNYIPSVEECPPNQKFDRKELECVDIEH